MLDKVSKYLPEFPNGDKITLHHLLSNTRFQIFPEAEDKFFIKVAPALITFEKDSEGKVAKMLMHHGGRTMPAERLN